jgi:hypothetical protein
LVVTAIATLAIGLSGCSSETPGSAVPGATDGGGGAPPSTDDTATPPSTEPSEDEDGGTAALEPCELLTAEDLTALGLPTDENQERDVGPARGCQWQASGSHTVTVGVIDELGLDNVVSDTDVEQLTVGSHDAVRYSSGGTCGVAIAVTDSSRVDVLGTANGDMTRGCQVANQAAELVEPHLP